ncbi:cation:H+ antiporter [Nakamurella panacisegetis]|uniref:Cation:H+ antiporter n=1 Tax=Nakamurella panacisegetis TaxID=1090615 RepID=A0A1H0P621_9ACTN|nr:sodium:calcium antiporter [Nakamurella panacisegetis]SDP00140.1 cation:H+ antiporter [Nakamurella panacisegetis]
MALTIFLLLVSAVAIYLACEWFVNAVEWLGSRLNVGTVAVGSVLAAVGTALPESVVTLVAVAFGATPDRKEIGVGAAMGGPLVLSTIAYSVVGVSLLAVHRSFRKRPDGSGELVQDQTWFMVIFIAKLALGLLVFSWKPWLAWLFLFAYAIYVVRELRDAGGDGGHSSDGLEPLKLQPRKAIPTGWAIGIQTAITLGVIFAASQLFVAQLEKLGPHLGLAPAVVAVLLAPIATELPEVLNAVIWVRQGKPGLALANVSGSMMVQATIPSALGIAFTPWHFTPTITLAGIVTLASIIVMIVLGRLRKLTSGTLLFGFGLYAVFFAGMLVLN